MWWWMCAPPVHHYSLLHICVCLRVYRYIATVLDVRRTVSLYAGWAGCSLISVTIVAYLVQRTNTIRYATTKTVQESSAKSMSSLSSMHRLSMRRTLLAHIAALALVTVLVTTIVHSLVKNELLPEYDTNPRRYRREEIERMKSGEGKLLNARTGSHARYAYDPPRCNTIEEQQTPQCKRAPQSKSTPKSCSKLPCLKDERQAIDTNALAGPLHAFAKVIPTPEYSFELPNDVFWHELRDVPIVIRDVLEVKDKAISKSSRRKTSIGDDSDVSTIIDGDRIWQSCIEERGTACRDISLSSFCEVVPLPPLTQRPPSAVLMSSLLIHIYIYIVLNTEASCCLTHICVSLFW